MSTPTGPAAGPGSTPAPGPVVGPPSAPSPAAAAGRPTGPAAAPDRPRSSAYVLLALVAVIWGVHWAVAKVGLETIPPFQYGVLRVAIGFGALVAILAVRGDLRPPPRADLPIVVSVGLGQIAVGIGLMNLALEVVPAGRSSILVYTMPLWVALIGVAFFHLRLDRLEVAGLALGIIGIVVLLNPLSVDWGGRGEAAGGLMLLASAVVWALTTIHIRRHTWHATPFQLQPWQLLVGGIPLVVLALVHDGGTAIAWSLQTVLVLLYSGILATAFAYWATQTVVRSLGPIAATTGFLAVPVVGLLAGSLLLGEALTLVDLVGFGLVLAGVAATSIGGAPRLSGGSAL